VILAVLLGCASVVGCVDGGDGDDQTQAGGETSDGGSGGGDNGGDGDNGGGAPGIPDNGSGGGAPGAPIDIPALQQVGAISLEDALGILEADIRPQCPGGDVCVVLQPQTTGDGENCTFGGTDPDTTAGAVVESGDTVVVFATCTTEGGGETEGEGETEVDGEGETDTGTETDSGGEAETEGAT
jgi:hypothetical protein